MRKGTARQQTLFLALINGAVRMIGFCMRVALSRLLGAEIMGIGELAGSIHMLAITPLTSGLPLAVSRLTAKETAADAGAALGAGKRLVWLASLFFVPLYLLLSPWIARWTGDVRVLPSLLFSAPCIFILGYSGVYNGYCFGTERVFAPAWSEGIEQLVRAGLAISLVTLLPGLAAAWSAAIPIFSTMVAEICGLVFVLVALRPPHAERARCLPLMRPVLHLALPATGSRMIATALRSMMAVLTPVLLVRSGLPQTEATARLGMLSGMVLPVVMAPCIFTSALSMVALPRLSKAEGDLVRLKALLRQFTRDSLLIGLLCMAGVYLLAPFAAARVFRLPELTPLFRVAAPLVPLMSLAHISSGMVAGLGQQKRAFGGALLASTVTLLLHMALTIRPALRLTGALVALGVGEVLTVCWNMAVLRLRCRQLQTR